MVQNVDLNFTGDYSPPAPNNVNLNFGNPPVDPVSAELRIALAAPVLRLAASGDTVDAVLQIVLAAPVLAVSATYSNQVSRPLASSVGQVWQQAESRSDACSSQYQNAKISRKAFRDGLQQAAKLGRSSAVQHEQALNMRRQQVICWRTAMALGRYADSGFGELFVQHIYRQIVWQKAALVQNIATSGFVQLLPMPLMTDATWQVALGLNAKSAEARHQVAESLDSTLWIPCQVATQPKIGRSPSIPPPPDIDPYVPDPDLNFICDAGRGNPARVNLNFSAGAWCPMYTRKVFIIVNEVFLKRVSDDVPIEMNGCSVGTDRDSFAWSFSASIPHTELDKVKPTVDGLIEVELSINSLIWRFVIENYGQRKQFAKTDIDISGRSLTAYLTEPYAPKRDYNHASASFAAALADAELNRGGAPSGFGLDWQLIDELGWPVPENTLNYQNLTPLQAIQKIAKAGGGYVQSHPSDPTVMVVPDYPSASWQWAGATPNKSIILDLIKSESLQWQEKPAYNGVYVEGVVSGVAAFVRLTGTAGENQAEMYVDRMTCDVQAARQKGLSILSEGGKQAKMTIDMPLHNSIGLIKPSMLVEIDGGESNTWRGLVRGVTISVSLSGGAVVVNKSLEMERHY
ncbi:MAG: hypothetical protein VXW65_11920 [Pseudomonadota bacterium]|nr:hypothetical protein [Pseudomonadota bacterium]